MFSNQFMLQESFQDLKEDFEELLYLTSHFFSQLEKFAKDIKRVKKSIRPESYKLIEQEVIRISKRLEKYKNHITYNIRHITENKERRTENIKQITTIENEKKIYSDLIRTQVGLIGSLITCLDWQSPSFDHTLYSQAGKQEGKIRGTINDYKRDTHLDEEEFERAYLREYIDATFKFNLKALMTSSGMSAFTTIFNFLLMEGKLKGKVLMGKSSYFQYKQLMVSGLRNQIIEVDELETDKIIEVINKEKPSAIFLDSLCNAADIPTPDLKAIINFLVQDYKQDVYLIIDNTGLSVSFQPFKLIIGRNRKIHLLLFESLMKYVHFGLDRVTGGIIVAKGRDASKLLEYRKHLGTNIPDASVYSFPKPNRKMLEKRLERLQRNALCLAKGLQEYIDNQKKCSVKKIIYPSLSNQRLQGQPLQGFFQGSFLNLSFKKKSVRLYKRFIDLVIKEAKKEKVDLIAGTSFGLNTTRIYLTSLWTKYGEPFVRVSVGTEDRLQVEALKEVFINTIKTLNRFVI